MEKQYGETSKIKNKNNWIILEVVVENTHTFVS